MLHSFPENYALFDKMRPKGRSHKSNDAHLYGSRTVLSFRSPEEFYEHAEWLVNHMQGKCGCQYCNKSYIGRGKRKKASPHTRISYLYFRCSPYSPFTTDHISCITLTLMLRNLASHSPYFQPTFIMLLWRSLRHNHASSFPCELTCTYPVAIWVLPI